MNEYTPTFNDIHIAYANYRVEEGRCSWDEAIEECDRFFIAHDQGIRDAVKPPEMTAREYLEAAFEAADPVPEGRDVPVGVTIIARRENGKIWVLATGLTSGAYDDIDVRTLEPLPPAVRPPTDPLPPLIPDDCNRVFASVEWNPARLIWIRGIGDPDRWRAADGNAGGWNALTRDLIDPKPVPEEER